MIKPEDVAERTDETRTRRLADLEAFIDGQLVMMGLTDGAAVVKLPEGVPDILEDAATRYRAAGWDVKAAGMGFLEFRRGAYCKGSWGIGNNCKTCWRCLATDPRRPR